LRSFNRTLILKRNIMIFQLKNLFKLM